MKKNFAKYIVIETNVNYYAWSFISEGFFSSAPKKYLGDQIKFGVIYIENDNGRWGVDIEDWHRLGAVAVGRIRNRKLSSSRLLREHYVCGQRLFALCSRIERAKLGYVKPSQLSRWFKVIWKDFTRLNGLGFIPVISDYEGFTLTNELVMVLQNRGVPESRVQEYLSTIISSPAPTLYWEEQKDLLRLCMAYESIKKIATAQKFEQHIKKYTWLNYGYQGPAWSREDFLERAGIIFKKEQSPAAQYREHTGHLKRLAKEQSGLTKKLKLSGHEKRLFQAARDFMACKAYRIEVRHRVQYIFDMIFMELCKQKSVPLNLFRYATREEILKIISGKRVDEKNIIERRKKMAEVTERGKKRFIAPSRIDGFLRSIIQQEEEVSGDEVFGQSAYRGIVRGTVKIVNNMGDIYKVSHGDILISVSTNPEFLPAMYRAAGFVTDAGGVTSHAAIVSREMKKPCIVGAKVATKLFADGDRVEVDATRGIVKRV